MVDPPNHSISAVRYDRTHRRIVKVRVHTEPSHFVLGEWFRHQVVESILAGNRWTTIIQDGVDWRGGAQVRAVVIRGREYLRTDSNEFEKDDLGELPNL